MSESGMQFPEIDVLVGAAESIWADESIKITITMKAPTRIAEEIEKISNKSFETIMITDSDIRHIKKGHGRGESDRGQSDIMPEDFRVLPTLLSDFDDIEEGVPDKLGNSRYMLRKQIGDMHYLALVQRGKRKLEIKTFYKRKMSGA
ncbi:MAG: hypothetical protein LBG50_03270 [Clostridiales Family XIII bacterium]|jgi:hypothetical protein|nr:hypothetical protein [Clostridiales Family XIII bacterium]